MCIMISKHILIFIGKKKEDSDCRTKSLKEIVKNQENYSCIFRHYGEISNICPNGLQKGVYQCNPDICYLPNPFEFMCYQKLLGQCLPAPPPTVCWLCWKENLYVYFFKLRRTVLKDL